MTRNTDVTAGQVYALNDPRAQGRTVEVVDVLMDRTGWKAVCKVLTNSDDVQALLDDKSGTPGTRSYMPKDRRGAKTRISLTRLNTTRHRDYSLVQTETVAGDPQ